MLPTFEEALQLVHVISGPGHSPQQVQQAQQLIQTISSSPQGWEYATKFLDTPDTYARFHGASILKSKISKEWSSIQNEAASLMQRLIDWFVKFVNEHSTKVVIRKVSAAFVAILLRAPDWDRALLHLSSALKRSLLGTSGAIIDTIDSPILDCIKGLEEYQINSLIEFSRSLAEASAYFALSQDLGNAGLDYKLLCEQDDVMTIITQKLQTVGRSQMIPDDVFQCFQAWCEVSLSSPSANSEAKRNLTAVLSLFIEQIGYDDGDIALLGALQEVFERFSGLVTRDQLAVLGCKLASPEAETTIRLRTSTNDSDILTSYVQLLVAYGEIATQDIVYAVQPEHHKIRRFLFELLNGHGYAGVEDDIAPRVVGFWINFTEFVENDEARHSSLQKPKWLLSAEGQILEVLWCCAARIKWPPGHIIDTWDSEELENFRAFRTDVEEMAQLTYVIHGISFLSQVAQRAQEAFNQSDLAETEVCLWIIIALSESSAIHDDATSAVLAGLFNSQLFKGGDTSLLQAGRDFIRLRKAEIKVITAYAEFFVLNPAYIIPLLDFLFAAMRDVNVDEATARAVATICSKCRSMLVSKIEIFLTQCLLMIPDQSIKEEVKENMLSATTCIIQASHSDVGRGKPLRSLLEAILKGYSTGLGLISSDVSAARLVVLSSLRYLLSVAKAIRQPDEEIVDDEIEDTACLYWSQGPGRDLQNLTLQILSGASQSFNADTEIMEICCQIIRTGFNESRPGLFVYAPVTIAEFLESTSIGTGRLEYIIDTAGTMLVKQTPEVNDEIDQISLRIIVHAKTLVPAPGDNGEVDPELLAAVLDLMSKMTPRYMRSLLVAPRHDLDLFKAALLGLRRSEPLLKQAAAHFWALFVANHQLDYATTAFHHTALDAYAPALCHELIFQIAGTAARSQLDTLAEPIKKLVFHRAIIAKRLFEASLTSHSFPSARIDGPGKRMWLLKLMSLRGGRQTNTIVKEFWIQCSGSELSYMR